MDRRNHPSLRIVQEHRHAIRGPHGHHQPRLIGHQRVPASFESVALLDRPIDDQRIRPVNLFDGQNDARAPLAMQGPWHSGTTRCHRDGRQPGAEKMFHPIRRRRKRRRGDDL